MTRREREPLLFDLPAAASPAPGSRRRSAGAKGNVLPLFPDSPGPAAAANEGGQAEPQRASLLGPARDAAAIAPFSSRLLAGLLDLAIFGAVTALTAVGAMALLPRGSTLSWLPVLIFLLVFSLFATVLPLAFWRRTAGMALARVEVRALDGEAISFRQAFVRWLGGLLTILGAGIPLLVALSGRSLTDRVSGSRIQRR